MIERFQTIELPPTSPPTFPMLEPSVRTDRGDIPIDDYLFQNLLVSKHIGRPNEAILSIAREMTVQERFLSPSMDQSSLSMRPISFPQFFASFQSTIVSHFRDECDEKMFPDGFLSELSQRLLRSSAPL
jgi:hypothetical protein